MDMVHMFCTIVLLFPTYPMFTTTVNLCTVSLSTGSTKVIQILACFSMYSNGKKLFATKSTDGNIGCLNGIRVLSMCWILLCHRFMDTFFLPLINLVYALEVIYSKLLHIFSIFVSLTDVLVENKYREHVDTEWKYGGRYIFYSKRFTGSLHLFNFER